MAIAWCELGLGGLVGWFVSAFARPQGTYRWLLMKMGRHPHPRLGEANPHEDAEEKWWHVEVTLDKPWWCPRYEVTCTASLIYLDAKPGLLFVREPEPIPEISLRAGSRAEIPLVTRRLTRDLTWCASVKLLKYDIPAKVTLLTHSAMIYCGDRVVIPDNSDTRLLIRLHHDAETIAEGIYSIVVPSTQANNDEFRVSLVSAK